MVSVHLCSSKLESQFGPYIQYPCSANCSKGFLPWIVMKIPQAIAECDYVKVTCKIFFILPLKTTLQALEKKMSFWCSHPVYNDEFYVPCNSGKLSKLIEWKWEGLGKVPLARYYKDGHASKMQIPASWFLSFPLHLQPISLRRHRNFQSAFFTLWNSSHKKTEHRVQVQFKKKRKKRPPSTTH